MKICVNGEILESEDFDVALTESEDETIPEEKDAAHELAEGLATATSLAAVRSAAKAVLGVE